MGLGRDGQELAKSVGYTHWEFRYTLIPERGEGCARDKGGQVMADLEGIVGHLMADAGVGWEPEQREGRKHVWAPLERGMSQEEIADWFREGVLTLFLEAGKANYTVDPLTIVAEITEGHLVVGAVSHPIVEQ